MKVSYGAERRPVMRAIPALGEAGMKFRIGPVPAVRECRLRSIELEPRAELGSIARFPLQTGNRL